MSRCLRFPSGSVIENTNNPKSNSRDVPEWRVYRVFFQNTFEANICSPDKNGRLKSATKRSRVYNIIAHQLTAV